MNLLLKPALLCGEITPPPSKSQLHRLLIARFLAGQREPLKLSLPSEDILATGRCLEALDTPSAEPPLLDCGESGSTLRFLVPLALVLRGGGVLTGRGRLMERPMRPYEELCARQGIAYRPENGRLTVQGMLRPDVFFLAGDISSQFITGLLLSLPLLNGDSEILLTTPLESRGYVDLTLEVLARFGVRISYDGDRRFVIPGGQRFLPSDMTAEADYSQAAFYCAANGMGSSLVIRNLNPDSSQGDKVILTLSRQLSLPGPVTADVSQCPDLVPALAVQAALRAGQKTRLINAGRLRMKESDRLDTVTAELNRLGARITQTSDALEIRGVSGFHGKATVSSHNDHRIAMMLAMAATRADGPVLLTNAGCVAKSYPNFWQDYAALGGQYEEAAR